MLNKYAQFFRDNGFFAGSKIKVQITDNTYIGKELVLSKGNDVIQTKTIPASGKVEFFTDDSGVLTLSSDNGTAVISGSVEITNYATYNVTLDGANSDTERQIYGSTDSITFDAEKSSEVVNIAYTGDKSTLSVNSSNPNVANVSVNENKVTVTDAGKGFMGTSEVTVTVAKKQYEAKSFNIHVEKTNGTIDKSWTGLKNIVESGREAELCEVGEEFEVTLSNGRSITFIIGAIDHDYDNQIIFVPKRYDYLDKIPFDRSSSGTNRYENSSLCAYLNGDFMKMLPTDLQEVISPKTVEYAISNTTLVSYTKKIWLPREYEILGFTSQAYNKEREIYRIKGMQCFSDNLVTLYEDTSSSYNSDNSISTCSPYHSGTANIVTAYRYKRDSEDRYETYYKSTEVSKSSRPFPCFHLIKET